MDNPSRRKHDAGRSNRKKPLPLLPENLWVVINSGKHGFSEIRSEIDSAHARKKKICFEDTIAFPQSRCKDFINILESLLKIREKVKKVKKSRGNHDFL
jgi:hypothetical protein